MTKWLWVLLFILCVIGAVATPDHVVWLVGALVAVLGVQIAKNHEET